MRQIGSRAFKRSAYRIRLSQTYASSLVVYVRVPVCVYLIRMRMLLSHASSSYYRMRRCQS